MSKTDIGFCLLFFAIITFIGFEAQCIAPNSKLEEIAELVMDREEVLRIFGRRKNKTYREVRRKKGMGMTFSLTNSINDKEFSDRLLNTWAAFDEGNVDLKRWKSSDFSMINESYYGFLTPRMRRLDDIKFIAGSA